MPLYEFDKYESRLMQRETVPKVAYTPFREAAQRAFLLWGEHCTECASPDCFDSCQLYQPRPDRRCRRFEFGMYANRSFPTGFGPAAEVVFKRWGVLTARGNATMFPAGRVRVLERVALLLSSALNKFGRVLDWILRDIRYSYATFALLEHINDWLLRRPRVTRPDAFIFECFNPRSATISVQFYMSIERARLPVSITPDQLPAPFIARFAIPPGYFRRDIPVRHFEQILETRLPFGMSVVPDALEEGAHLVFLALDFVNYSREVSVPGSAGDERPVLADDEVDSRRRDVIPIAVKPLPQANARAPAKCVVFDLDQTIWSGVLLEGEVELKAGMRQVLETLDSRGILLSIASKNSAEHVLQKLSALGIAEYFLYPQINWGQKSESLKTIASSIDIGVDTFIFIDDNPFDRDEVSSRLPSVEVLDESSIGRLCDHPRLKGSDSPEARSRRMMYRQAMVRTDAAKGFEDDYIGFLRSCRIRLMIRAPEAADMERVAELIQRTNQLNFSGNKYRNDEVTAVLADATTDKHILECSDRYGSYGIVGFCMSRRTEDSVRLMDFMLSCRVQGKLIEQSLFDFLVRRSPGTRRLEVNFKKTGRNTPAQSVLRKLGFDPDNDGLLSRVVAPGDLAVDFMEVVAPESDAS